MRYLFLTLLGLLVSLGVATACETSGSAKGAGYSPPTAEASLAGENCDHKDEGVPANLPRIDAALPARRLIYSWGPKLNIKSSPFKLPGQRCQKGDHQLSWATFWQVRGELFKWIQDTLRVQEQAKAKAKAKAEAVQKLLKKGWDTFFKKGSVHKLRRVQRRGALMARKTFRLWVRTPEGKEAIIKSMAEAFEAQQPKPMKPIEDQVAESINLSGIPDPDVVLGAAFAMLKLGAMAALAYFWPEAGYGAAMAAPLGGLDLSKRKKKLKARGRRFIQQQLDSAQSAAESRLYLTAKVFRSGDRTFLSWDSTEVQEDLVKLALTADDQWASSFAATMRQTNQMFALCEQHHDLPKGSLQLELQFGDVLFVQSLKDGSGREPDVNALTSILHEMGYTPVTPGFWIKRLDEEGRLTPLACWHQAVFPNNMELRSRARGLSTTPITHRLDIDAKGKTVRYFVGNFETHGHVGCDGGNFRTAGLQVNHEAHIEQIRIHTPYCDAFSKDGDNPKDQSGFQIKGRVSIEDVKLYPLNGKYIRCDREFIKTLEDEHLSDLQEGILIHFDNVKGALSKEIEEEVKKLGPNEFICLNEWWYNRADLTRLVEPDLRRLFGGVIAQDYSSARTSVSWQDTQVRDPQPFTEGELGEALEAQLEKVTSRLYSTKDKTVLKAVMGDPELAAAASALEALNPRKVAHIVFGAGRRVPTYYCEQMEMPQKYVVFDRSNWGKDVTRIEGRPTVALFGQPQLYHQSIATATMISYKMLQWCLDEIDYKEERPKLGEGDLKAAHAFLAEFLHLCGEKEARKRISTMLGWRKSKRLIVMSKALQDQLQRDSDGDRIGVDLSSMGVASAIVHEQTVASLPMPKVEVSKATPYDGDEVVMKDRPFQYTAGPEATLRYVCAANQGQGPTGQSVNLASMINAHIPWERVGGHWQPQEEIKEEVLFFYAVMVLLVQNCIDRQKKPWEVLRLLSWFLVSKELYKRPLVGGKDYQAEKTQDNGGDWVPTMVLGEAWTKRFFKTSVEDMHNVSSLKPFFTWTVNLLKAGYYTRHKALEGKLSLEKQIGDIEKIADLFSAHDLEDDKPFDWAPVAEILGHEDPVVLGEGWVWPERAVAWKKEASLETPLADAAPCIKLFSEKAIEANLKAREAAGVTDTPERLIASCDVQATPAEINFVTSFCQEYGREKAGENDKFSQSEFFQARGDNDANKYLDMMKAVIRDMEGSSVPHRIAYGALVNPGKDGKKQDNVLLLASMFRRVWTVKGYDEWLMARKPLTWLGRQLATGRITADHAIDLLDKDVEEGTIAWWLMKLLSVAGCANTERGHAKAKAIMEVLETNARAGTVRAEDLEVVRGVGPVTVGRVREFALKTTQPPERTIWPEAIWSDFFPALEIQFDLAENSDVKTDFFVKSGEGFNEHLAFLERYDGSDPAELRKLLTAPYMALGAQFYLQNIKRIQAPVEGDFSVEEILDETGGPDRAFILIGLMIDRGYAPRTHEFASVAAPFMQGLRFKRLLQDQGMKGADLVTSLRELLFEETPYSYIVEGEQHFGVRRRLRGRVDYPISNRIVSELAGRLAETRSFYLLQQVKNLWVDRRNQPRLTTSKRWVLHDSLQYKIEGVNPRVAIRAELELKMAAGHCYSVAELSAMKTIYTKVAEAKKDKAPEHLMQVASYLGKKLEKSHLLAGLKWSENLDDPNAALADEVRFPYHWGGNAKWQNRGWGYRTSAYRPIWRFVMASHPDGSLPEEQLKEARFALFEELSGASLIPGKKVGQENKAPDRKGFIEHFINNAQAVLDNSGNSGYTPRERNPDCNPVGPAFIHQGKALWSKIPRSPVPESFAHAKMRTGKIIHAVNFDTVPHQRLVLKDGEPYEFTRFMATRHSIVGNPDSYVNGKLNGVRIPSLILRELQGGAEYNPLILEFVLGLLHTTSVVDSYVVQHWAAHADRIGNKTPSALRRFMRISKECAPLYPDREYMDALISANLMKGGK